MSKIAIYGGTFDPPTFAHLLIIEQIQKNMDFDEFYIIPCNLPNNDKINITNNADRYNMLKIALSDHPNVKIDDRELKRGTISYTIDTLKSFDYENNELFLIMGDDEFNSFENWKNFEEIANIARIVCIISRDTPSIDMLNKYNPYIYELNPKTLISSSLIRNMISKGESVKYLLPDKVIEYIKKRNLYTK